MKGLGEMYRKLSYIAETKKDCVLGDTKDWSKIR